MRPGRRIAIEHGPEAEILSMLDGPQRVIRFDQAIEPFFQQVGNVPLPPYIHEKLARTLSNHFCQLTRFGCCANRRLAFHA